MRVLKIVFIIFMSFNFLSAGMEPPTKELDAADVMDSAQKKRDMKIWQNMLFVFGQVRQTAEGAVEVLNTVSDFALKSFSTFKQVQNLVGKGKQIWQSMQKLKGFNAEDLKNPEKWKEALGGLDKAVPATWYSKASNVLSYQTGKVTNILSNVEENRQNITLAIENKTFDGLGGIKSIEIDKTDEKWREKLKEKEIKIKNELAAGTQEISGELYWFKRGVLQGVEVVDPYLTEKYGYHPKVKKNIAIASVAEDAMAGAAVRKEYAQNQLTLSRYSIANAAGGLNEESSGGNGETETAITAQASAEALSAQNTLFSSLGEHESINALTKVMSAIALSKADNYLMKDYNQKLYVTKNMRKHSEALSVKLQEIRNAEKKD